MRICFIHQNMPAQFRHLIAALLERGDEVVVIGEQPALERWKARHPRLHQFGYAPAAAGPAAEFERMAARGRTVAKALRAMLERGLRPDLLVVHPGWGEMMFVRSELPDTPMLGYCEFFYRDRGSDVDFDPEYPAGDGVRLTLQLRRAVQLLALNDMDAGLCPTAWQRDQHPAEHLPKLEVLHDGIDTAIVRPDPAAEVTVGGHVLRAGDPVVTYVARNLEPYRGFHVFMRALPELQRLAPQARVVIVGGDDVSYGRRLAPGETYRSRLQAELGGRVDWSRVHFTGKLPYAAYLRLLQVSAVHAYLTYPFVLSWSLLEAMASGCCLVASRTPPVEEVIADGVNGRLVDFFDPAALATALAGVLHGQGDVAGQRAAARRTVVEGYDLKTRCLPGGLALLDRVAASRRPAV